MRKLLLALLAFAPFLAGAQGVATFESLPLPTADTYYVNFTAPGTDVGFSNGNAWFPCVYDTGFGASFLSRGFVYSNRRDSVSTSYANQFSARPAAGAFGSPQYAVAYGAENIIRRTTPAFWGGMWVTNSTLTYYSLKDGDGFAKKFGGVTGRDLDWFKMVIHGYSLGHRSADSVEFFLADYRFGISALNYIVKDWTWVDLRKFHFSDSISISLKSSDNSSFGMNTPAYFCIDNLSVNAENNNVPAVAFADIAEIAPNPAGAFLSVRLKSTGTSHASILDATGRIIGNAKLQAGTAVLNTASLPAGAYFLRLEGQAGSAVTKFIKQ